MKRILIDVPDETKAMSVTIVGGWNSDAMVSVAASVRDLTECSHFGFDGRTWYERKEEGLKEAEK